MAAARRSQRPSWRGPSTLAPKYTCSPTRTAYGGSRADVLPRISSVQALPRPTVREAGAAQVSLSFLLCLRIFGLLYTSSLTMLVSALVALAAVVSAAPTASPASSSTSSDDPSRGFLKADGFTTDKWLKGFEKAQALVASLTFEQKSKHRQLQPPPFQELVLRSFNADDRSSCSQHHCSAYDRPAGLLGTYIPLAGSRTETGLLLCGRTCACSSKLASPVCLS